LTKGRAVQDAWDDDRQLPRARSTLRFEDIVAFFEDEQSHIAALLCLVTRASACLPPLHFRGKIQRSELQNHPVCYDHQFML